MVFALVSGALPVERILPAWPLRAEPAAAAGEVVSSPKYLSATVMPNGHVGLLFVNGSCGVNVACETRFKRYGAEWGLDPSIQLSTAGPMYPQITTFRGRVVAAYVDTRSPNTGKLTFRASDDNGVTWGAEFYPFGAETFDREIFTPRLVVSRDQQTLYVFNVTANETRPKYRFTTDSTLASWSAAAEAGDATMRVAKASNCGASAEECRRAHSFGFMETATAGSWVYIALSDSGFGQSGRGTQVGTLGGSWSAQVDHGGSGGLTGCCGESTATTFLDRDGNVLYLRVDDKGQQLYSKKSTDGGYTWGPRVYAYTANLAQYTTAAPVGVYVAGYTRGEYVWFAGFGGLSVGNDQEAVRAIPLWRAPKPYVDSSTARLFGSLGGDFDFGTAYPYAFGWVGLPTGIGAYKTSAEDLALPGRLLPFSFTRFHNSADIFSGPLGPGWSHSFNWQLTENADLVEIRRGDGRRDTFTRNPDGTYANQPGVFDTLAKNGDGSFSLTLKNQTQYELTKTGRLLRVHEPAGNEMLLRYISPNLVAAPLGGATASYTAIEQYNANYQPYFATNGVKSNGTGPQISWAARGWSAGDWWRVTWSAGQAVSRVRLWDRAPSNENFGTSGRLRFSDGSTVNWSGLPNDPGANGENFLEVSFARKSGITWLEVVADAGGSGNGGLAEVEAYDDETADPASDGKLSVVTDTVGRRITLSYSEADRLTKLEDPTGRKVTYSYDPSGRLTSVVDKIGNAPGQDPNLHKWQYAYDGASQRLTQITDPDGRLQIRNVYDASGRLAEQRDALDNLTQHIYGASQTVVRDPRGNDTTQTFDSRWRPISQTNQVGSNFYSIQYTYDAQGNVLSKTDRNGKRTDFTYDSRGNLLTKTDPQIDPQTPRYVTTYEYDAKNNLTRLTDARGFITTHTYDATTNVRLSTSAQIVGTTYATVKWEYADASNPGLATRIIAPRGNTGQTPDYTYSSTLAYDNHGNVIEEVDADGAKATYSYDTVGRRTAVVDPEGNATGGVPAEHTWTTAYDENDRVTSRSDPLGRATSFGYDRTGNQTSATDRNGNVTTFVLDGAARLWKVEQKPDPVNQPSLVYTTTVQRDAAGNVTSVTQANGVVTDYAYDAMNRLTSFTTHPATDTHLTTSYALDGNGNQTSRTNADGLTVSYAYDALNRLTSISASGLSTVTYAYDQLGQRIQMTDGTGTTSYQYDGLRRPTEVAQPNGTLTYAYDLDSNGTSLTYPGAGAVSYAYSPGGRLTSVTDWASRVSTYTYRPTGLPATVALPNGMTTTYGYDRVKRLTSVANAVGANTISSHLYTLDNDGNRTVLDEFVQGITSPGGTDRFTFSYDGLHRLTSVGVTNPESFVLDAASNISSRTGPSATNTYDQANRHTSDGSQTYVWSAADRLVQRGADTFGYDPLDRLTSSTVAGTSRTYAYNGDGLLQSRTHGATTSFVWSSTRLVQIGPDRVVYGLGPLYVVKSDGSTVTFARDGARSVRAELTAAGGVTAAFRYRAYGAIAQTTAGSPLYFGYSGELLDPSGLIYLRARWYDPASGRFLSRDPEIGEPQQPVSLNAYIYAHGNPARFSDPSGRCPPCAVVVVWGVIQIAMSAADAVTTAMTLLDRNASMEEKGISAGLFVLGLVDPVGGGYATAFKGLRATRGAQRAIQAVKGAGDEIATKGDEILKRFGDRRLSAAELAAQAKAAQRAGKPHGVSTTARDVKRPGVPSARRADVEQHFPVHDTPSRTDPYHRTVELPDPVTEDVAELFHDLFGFPE